MLYLNNVAIPYILLKIIYEEVIVPMAQVAHSVVAVISMKMSLIKQKAGRWCPRLAFGYSDKYHTKLAF